MDKIKILILVIVGCLVTVCKAEKVNLSDLNLKGAYIVNGKLYINNFISLGIEEGK